MIDEPQYDTFESLTGNPALLLTVFDLNLSALAENRLKSNSLYYVADILSWSDRELLDTPSMGKGSFNQVKESLREIGIEKPPKGIFSILSSFDGGHFWSLSELKDNEKAQAHESEIQKIFEIPEDRKMSLQNNKNLHPEFIPPDFGL